MNIPLKILLIFCFVSTMTSQDAFEGSGTDDTTATTPEAPGRSSTDTTAPPVTITPGPCDSSPCIGDSTCDARFDGTFVCICRNGLVYDQTSGCIQTKVFPGSLTLGGQFKPEMADRKSEEFQKQSKIIEKGLSDVLNDSGYIRSIVLSLREGSIIAEVHNFYTLSSNVSGEFVQSQIKNAIDKIPGATEFEGSTVCDLETCDSTTTTCEEAVNGIAMCTCNEGYIRSESTSQACIACPNGEMAVNGNSCKKCTYGFTGFNCSDPYLLIVIVVSTVLGALLIIFIVAFAVSKRNQKRSSSPKVDFSSSYGNKELHKPTGVPRIPRANPEDSWKSNSLEMTDSRSNQALVTKDRPESKARYNDYEDLSYKGQAYSGHSGRGVENGGVHNPYFRQDDDRTHRY